MKRLIRSLIIFSFLATAIVPAVPVNFEEPPVCPPNDPKCKPPLPPLG
jgi:hypothetical protein